MENVIIYQNSLAESSELVEYFHNLGFEPCLVSKRSELITAFSQGVYSRVYLEINKLSDIALINTIETLWKEVELILIIQPRLQEIIGILKDSNYKTINDITSIAHNMGNN